MDKKAAKRLFLKAATILILLFAADKAESAEEAVGIFDLPGTNKVKIVLIYSGNRYEETLDKRALSDSKIVDAAIKRLTKAAVGNK